MEYLIGIIIIGIIIAVCAVIPKIYNKFSSENQSDLPVKIQDADLIKTFSNLEKESFDEILKLYKNQFGRGAARYARKTFQKWKSGKVRPNRQTFERFLIQLPTVMSYDLKCEILRRLMVEFCSKNDYQLTVYTDDWETTLEPMVKRIVDNSYTVELPRLIEKKLEWLANGEMRTAQKILRQTQIEESKIAVSLLRTEMSEIEKLLVEIKGESRVTHRLKFPYGTINLEIRKR